MKANLHFRLILCILLGVVASTWAKQVPALGDENTADKPPPNFTLTIEGPISPEFAPVVGRLTTHFYECYPRLLKRFENPDKPANRRIRLIFEPSLRAPAQASGDRVQISINWMRQHPDDIGIIAHELTHIVQAYPDPNPGWLTEGIADYARHIYGPANQVGWKLPERLTEKQSYRDSYGVTARFLLWLDEKFPDTVDKLHRKMQLREFQITDFQVLTGKDVDTLWKECVADLRPTP